MTARENFNHSIKDAELLLLHVDELYVSEPNSPTAEVCKRAGLIMALTAWETYVEDRIEEVVERRLGEGNESFQNQFLKRHLRSALKSFHTPDSAKTSKLFSDYLGLDIAEKWRWNHFEPERAKRQLDSLVQLRGDVVHRARAPATAQEVHPVKRVELQKAIRFIRDLVDATQTATEK